MARSTPGALRIFSLFGIDVLVDWTWAVVAVFFFYTDVFGFGSVWWNAATYVSLFAIVTMHEFGHALACRSVGGRAERIVLWPLGGIAFVQPPQRPGALLWSIAAGPLVNVLLLPVLLALVWALVPMDAEAARAPWQDYLFALFAINTALLVFNVLPIYPLDGGQMLQALLWFVLGRARSLRIAASIGLVVAIAGGLAALSVGDLWLVLIAAFVGTQAWAGVRMAGHLAKAESAEGWRM